MLSAPPACACADHLCAHTFGGQGSQAAQCFTVMLRLLPLAMGNAVGAGMTQLPFTGNMLGMLKKIKILGADLRSDLCPSAPLILFNFFFPSNSRLDLPSLAVSLSECFQLHACLPEHCREHAVCET